MKLIMAMIKPYKVDDVRDALESLGVTDLTITEVRGFGRQLGHTETYRGVERVVDYMPKFKVEVVVGDALLDAAIDVIVANTRTGGSGRIGDGKILVVGVDGALMPHRVVDREIAEVA